MAISLPIVSKFIPDGVNQAMSAIGRVGGAAAAAAGAAVSVCLPQL